MLHVGERGGRIQTIFFPSLNIEYSLVYDAFPALSLFDRDFHTEKKKKEMRKNKQVTKHFLDSGMKSQSQTNLELLYFELANSLLV